MKPSVVLVVEPAIDFDTFLSLTHKMLGYSPASAVDQNRRTHSDTERFLSCLASLRDQNAPAGVTPNLLSHATFSVLIAADERDLLDIIEAASGMSVVIAETVARSVMLAVITGTLAQWRDAVKSGATQATELNVRDCYCKIMGLFSEHGLSSVWQDYQSKPLNDHTFYLEDKRR